MYFHQSNSITRRYLRASLAASQVACLTQPHYKDTATIAATLQRLRAENYEMSETALRRFVHSGQIPSVMYGNKALMYYPSVVAYLTGCAK